MHLLRLYYLQGTIPDFPFINVCYPYSNLISGYSFYRWGIWDSEWLRNLPWVIYLVRRSQDLNLFHLVPEPVCLTSMQKDYLTAFLSAMVGATSTAGEIQGIYLEAGNRNRSPPLQTGDDSSFKHDLLISQEYFQMEPSGFTPMG